MIELVLGSEASPGLPISREAWAVGGRTGLGAHLGAGSPVHRMRASQSASVPVDRHIGLKTWPLWGESGSVGDTWVVDRTEESQLSPRGLFCLGTIKETDSDMATLGHKATPG